MKDNNKGIYLLILRLSQSLQIAPGRLSETTFPPGLYLYVGRSKNSLRGRISRHLRKQKKNFWHIDYLLREAVIEDIWIKPECFDECLVTHEIHSLYGQSRYPVNKFGASDCHCPGHLLYMGTDGMNTDSLEDTLNLERMAFDEAQL